ncbi:mitochondrial ribosomal protein S25-domain-containing protein [Kockovaella imperatae]|uniref:Small ribosomal subunit protein mS23 n=1 Tax=Kockovaella imperatae TaxID=4999 RepID=A0A1Y1UQ27_9TREE|nr:mitochondrial ribosomal protein S25-domain-containing protein [Kockovaella imperatae]ORX40141.1 mitochondrial ribosomal protein S25-domain-containing protein [Kockovaella imperatae]
MRRIPQQIPELVGRLIKSEHISKQPTWYAAAMANPPPTLPPYESRPRPPLHINDGRASGSNTTVEGRPIPSQGLKFNALQIERLSKKQPKYGARIVTKPRKIVYPEDRLRLQFFKDFPFEAMRPVSLVEMRTVEMDKGVTGTAWKTLRQRGAYPTVENVVAFVLNLIESHGYLYSAAYTEATKQFVELRAMHEMSTLAAELEARHYGAEFNIDPFTRAHMKENKALDAHLSATQRGERVVSTRIKWKNPRKTRWGTELHPDAVTQGPFTGGQAYVEAWRRRAIPKAASSKAAQSPSSEGPSGQKPLRVAAADEAHTGEAGDAATGETVDIQDSVLQTIPTPNSPTPQNAQASDH